jgi:DNA invertase Pin-like site-specific DNA recombinase
VISSSVKRSPLSQVSRLARRTSSAPNLQDLIAIVGDLRRREIGFKSLHEALDTTTPGARLVFHVFAARGEFIRDRATGGRGRSRYGGRAGAGL